MLDENTILFKKMEKEEKQKLNFYMYLFKETNTDANFVIVNSGDMSEIYFCNNKTIDIKNVHKFFSPTIVIKERNGKRVIVNCPKILKVVYDKAIANAQ